MTTLSSTINTEYPSHFAVIQSRSYLANDFNPVQVWDGLSATSSDAGMEAPATAPTAPTAGAGNITAGVHRIRYRYYDSRSLYVSDPSSELSFTSSGSQSLLFVVGTHLAASADAKCDQIILEATTAGGITFYRVGFAANIAAATVTFNVNDNVLVQGDAPNALHGDFGHQKPPLFAILASHRGRLFGAGSTTRTRTVGVTNASAAVTGTDFSTMWAGRRIRFGTETTSYEIQSATATTITLTTGYTGSTNASIAATVFSKTPNRLYWSSLLYPEGWKPQSYARDCLNNRSDELRGLVTYQNELWIFGRHSAERLAFTSDPGTLEGQIIPVPGERGVINQRCLIEAEGRLYAWDRVGMYAVGQSPQHLSKPIDRTLVDYVDFAQSDEFHGVYDPTDRVLMWFFTKIGDTEPYYAACMELDKGRWYLISFKQAITASHVVPDSNGQVRAMLGDSNGFTWFYGIEGSWDGLPPTAPSVMTASGTPTATVVPVTQILPTSPSLAGVVVVNTANGQRATVESNTASTLTMIAPGFTDAPAADATLYAGGIDWEYESKWFTMPDSPDIRNVYLHVALHPSSATGKCRAYFYKNWAATPETLTVHDAAYSFPDGVVLGDGAVTSSTFMTFDLDGGNGDGIISIPVPVDWAKHWKVKLVCDRPDGEIRLLDVRLSPIAEQRRTEI